MSDRLERQWHQKGTGSKPANFADGFFIGEIEFQCEFGVRAFGEMQQAYANDVKHPALLALAYVLLVFAGNVGKILGASKDASKKTRARGKRLRETLGLQDADFENIRQARNFFEHFDERIEKYVGSHKGLLIDRRVLDHYPNTVELDDGRSFEPSFLQLLNTNTLDLTLYDQQFHIPEIVKQLQAIQAKAKAWHEARDKSAA